jgi:hypothetical protein
VSLAAQLSGRKLCQWVRRQLSCNDDDLDQANAEASDEDQVSSQMSSGSSSRQPSTNGEQSASNVSITRQASKTNYDQTALLWKDHEPIAQRLADLNVMDSDARLSKLEEYVEKSQEILRRIADVLTSGNLEQLDEQQRIQPVVRGLLDVCFRHVAQDSFQVLQVNKKSLSTKVKWHPRHGCQTSQATFRITSR